MNGIVRYKPEIITSSEFVDSENCNSIIFENIGQDHALIDGTIPLRTDGNPREFNNDPGITIKAQFFVKFDGLSQDKQVLIIKKFIDELPNTTNKSTLNSGSGRCGKRQSCV